MLTYTEKVLEMQVDSQDRRLLANRTYDRLNAEEFVLGPPESVEDDYIVENCNFVDCVVKPGPLMVLGGVQLRNVVFDNMRANDAFTIYSDCLLDKVTIRGNSESAGLWIKPNEPETPEIDDQRLRKRMSAMASRVKMMLNISEFDGPTVEILGIPPEKVSMNKSRHVVLRRSTRIDWKKLGVPSHSLWRIRLMKLNALGIDVGIYHVPFKEENEVAFREFELLRCRGLV